MTTPALLALANGTVVEGISIGAEGSMSGELVFNTSMTGYQEILTDPSYKRQIVLFTAAHIGNTGTTDEDDESAACHCSGMVIRDVPRLHSNWRSSASLGEYLRARGLVAIAGVDTRKLTRLLREQGVQGACIQAGVDQVNAEVALKQARGFAGLKGMDLAVEVTTDKPYNWDEGEWSLQSGYSQGKDAPLQVVVYDYGVKRNILRMLTSRGCRVCVVPATMPAEQVLQRKPDGVFLSNGPGDPEPCTYAIEAIRQLLQADIPIGGICLGHQLLGLACGAQTEKMAFGHHGANHPVQRLDDGRVMITSQNHGFTIGERQLPDALRVTHRSLFDNTVQGFAHTQKPAISFQGHPEASPGPRDAGAAFFDDFVALVKERSCA